MISRPLRSLKNAIVPDRVKLHRVRFGLAKGALLPVNLRHHTHVLMGLYEKEVAGWVRGSIRPETVFYDLGGGYGYYAVAVGRRLRGGMVYTFELDPKEAELLRQAISANRLEQVAEVIEGEVTDSPDPSRNRLSLDEFASRDGVLPPDLIKIDVEGAELKVLEGARGLLDKHHPLLFIETHSREVDSACVDLLTGLGYRFRFRQPEGRQWGPRPVEFNRWIWAE